MKTGKLMLMAAALLFAGSASIFAQDGEGAKGDKGRGGRGQHQGDGGFGGMERGGRRAEGGAGMFLKDLNLTEEQQTQIKAIHEKNSEKMKELGKAMAEAQKTFREATSGENIDEAKIRELSKTVADSMAEMAILRAKMQKEVEAILTPEQKAKLEEKKAEIKKKMEERRSQMEGRGEKRKEKKEDGEIQPPPPPPAAE